MPQVLETPNLQTFLSAPRPQQVCLSFIGEGRAVSPKPPLWGVPGRLGELSQPTLLSQHLPKKAGTPSATQRPRRSLRGFPRAFRRDPDAVMGRFGGDFGGALGALRGRFFQPHPSSTSSQPFSREAFMSGIPRTIRAKHLFLPTGNPARPFLRLGCLPFTFCLLPFSFPASTPLPHRQYLNRRPPAPPLCINSPSSSFFVSPRPSASRPPSRDSSTLSGPHGRK